MAHTQDIENRIGVVFNNKELLTQALMHRSFVVENRLGDLASNERLEFLGDAVLELVISEYLFEKFATQPEGTLTQWRSMIVNTKTLAQAFGRLDLGGDMLLSRGERSSGGFEKERILANMLEALIGAIYLDSGYKGAKEFIDRALLPLASELLADWQLYNPKGILQEKVQASKRITPEYHIIEEFGPDHQKVFRAAVFLEQEKLAQGEGKSKKEAEEDAARNALQELTDDQRPTTKNKKES